MISVIVAFPKLEEAKSIKGLLVRSGIDVMAACTSAAQVIHLTEDLDYGIVVSGYKFVDMMYCELLEYLPPAFDMLLVTSKRHYVECDTERVVCLSMPIKAAELVNTVNQLYDNLYWRKKREKEKPKHRSEEERQVIARAKTVLIKQRGMTEEEAHKYLQKKSMDNGTDLVETAYMVIRIF